MPGCVRLTIAVSLCCAPLVWGSSCPAAESGWGGSLVATSDYVFRGLSQTRGGPALQGDLHYQGEPGWFAGAWASNIDPRAQGLGQVEINLYAGWAWSLSPQWSTRLSYVRYLYPDAIDESRYDYGEWSGTVGYRDRWFATLAWSPDMVRTTTYGLSRRGHSLTYEFSMRQPVWRAVGVAAGAGYYDLSDVVGERYWAWNAMLTASFGSLELDLGRFGTDDTARWLFGGESADDRWALTGIWRF